MKMSEENYLTAGKLVTFTSGEYSCYSMHGTFVALETVTREQAEEVASALRAKAEAEEEKTGWYDGDLHEEFQAELIRKGWLVSVDNTEHHIGSYSYLKL